MRHLRSDYDAIQPWPQKRPHIVKVNGETREVALTDDPMEDDLQPIIGEDEPVFVLRAKDPSAPFAVRSWANDVRERGGDPDLVQRVYEWAEEMEIWREEHHPEKVVADTPGGLLR